MNRVKLPPLFLAACAMVVTAEAYAVFFDRDHTFEIAGREPYGIAEFGEGKAVAHAFLMRGEGLSAVRTQFASDVPAVARIKWTIFRGSLDEPPMTIAEQGESEVDVGRSPTWASFPMTRDGSSKDRWYTIEVQLVGARARQGDGVVPKLTALATQDNPDRGGVLWVNGKRQAGSLRLRADRLGRTLYRRFQVEAEPNLPPVLRVAAVQWILVLVMHWAFFTYAAAMVARE